MTKLPQQKKYSNDFQTPEHAVDILLKYVYIPPYYTIWEPAMGKGNIVNALRKKGYNVIGTDIIYGQDFLTYEPEKYDAIITNPPYSLREEFIKRCYDLIRPWALLMPLTTLEGLERQNLFNEYGITIIIPKRRINFETPTGSGSGSWFMTAWFVYGFFVKKPPKGTIVFEGE